MVIVYMEFDSITLLLISSNPIVRTNQHGFNVVVVHAQGEKRRAEPEHAKQEKSNGQEEEDKPYLPPDSEEEKDTKMDIPGCASYLSSNYRHTGP